ncbi:MAG: FkbM family methyltransferase [Anaerolineales bacterium]|nr:FkbM family methyltransferase [Anaerolineales bacterium]
MHECALGAAEGTVELYTWGSESSADSLKNTQRVPGRTPVKVSVLLTTLEKQYNLGVRPTVIKMDCEGGEMDVLRGGGNVSANLRPLVLTEFAAANINAFGIEPADLFKWAGDFNYKLFTEAFAPLVLPHDMVNVWARGEENFILPPSELGI